MEHKILQINFVSRSVKTTIVPPVVYCDEHPTTVGGMVCKDNFFGLWILAKMCNGMRVGYMCTFGYNLPYHCLVCLYFSTQISCQLQGQLQTCHVIVILVRISVSITPQCNITTEVLNDSMQNLYVAWQHG